MKSTRKPRRSSSWTPGRGSKRRRAGPPPAPHSTLKQDQTKAPADIVTSAALLELWAVGLGPEGWFVLAPVARSFGSPLVWRQANTEERTILDRAARDRFVAGHWSIRPGVPRGPAT